MKKQKVRVEGKTRNHFVIIDDSKPPVTKDLLFPNKEELKKTAEGWVQEILVKHERESPLQRTILPKKKTLRRELECYVIAWNTVLKDAVKSMDIISLLRNAHPTFRPSFTSQLLEAGMIGEWEASEFHVKPAKYTSHHTNWKL